MDYDVIIVGGGPAGLSAALILGRCRRKVLLCDGGEQRNRYSHGVHGFFSRDGIAPDELLSVARSELEKYPTVELLSAEITRARKIGERFEVNLADGRAFHARKLLLATGVVDELPKIKNIERFFGTSVFQCPYCDGWEVADQALAVYGTGERGFKFALNLTPWSKDILLFTDGDRSLDETQKAKLARNGIGLREEAIDCLEGTEGKLSAVRLENGERIVRKALFFDTPSFVRSSLVAQLGCHFSQNEGVHTKEYARTPIFGLYAAGNILRDVQLAIVAASDGAVAAFGINCDLTQEDLK